MTTVGFVRHGITEWNVEGRAQGQTDIPLNEAGKVQARALAERLLSEEGWDVIVSSDLIRARETAEIIAEHLHIDQILFDERLREIHCGLIEGLTVAERIAKWGENWREQALEMEPPGEAAKRAIACLDEITHKHEGKRILVVSHGALIGLALEKLVPGQYTKASMGNTSITTVTLNNDEWTCSLYNCTKHLDA